MVFGQFQRRADNSGKSQGPYKITTAARFTFKIGKNDSQTTNLHRKGKLFWLRNILIFSRLFFCIIIECTTNVSSFAREKEKEREKLN